MTLVAHRSDRNMDQLAILSQRYAIGAHGELIPQPGEIMRAILLKHPDFVEIPGHGPAVAPAATSQPVLVVPPPHEDDEEPELERDRDDATAGSMPPEDPAQWTHKQLATALALKHGKTVWSKPRATLYEMLLADLTDPSKE